MNPTLSHCARPADEVLFQDVAGEAVLLNLASERYFGLDPVGTRIWNLLGINPSLQSVLDALCLEYDAEPERLHADLLALVAQLAEAGLVELD